MTCPSTVPRAPLPVTSVISATWPVGRLRSWAASTTAAARACDDCASTLAAAASSRSASCVPSVTTSTIRGCPKVSVPVLSMATVRAFASRSRAPESLTIMPSFAARLTPAKNATGAASNSGHGVATTSTSASRTGSPDAHHAIPAIANDSKVKGIATRSAMRTTGACESCACFTNAMICWYCESAATARASISIASAPLTPPDGMRSPFACSTGSGSPVREDSSVVAWSDSSVPSTGTVWPGRTSSRSPTFTSSMATSTGPASVTRRAWVGAPSSRPVSCERAREAAYSSSDSPPDSMRQTTRAAQYSPTATVEMIAVIASKSIPQDPARMSRIMSQKRRAAIRIAKPETNHWR